MVRLSQDSQSSNNNHENNNMIFHIVRDAAIYCAVLYCPIAMILFFVSHGAVALQNHRHAIMFAVAEAGCILILLYTGYALPFLYFASASPSMPHIWTWPWWYVYVPFAILLAIKGFFTKNADVNYTINIYAIALNTSVISFIFVWQFYTLTHIQLDTIVP